MKSKYGILVLIALFSVVLSGCGASSKEVRFVDPMTPNHYYVIEDDTFTFHYLDLEGGTTWATTTRDQRDLKRLENEGTETTISGNVLRSDDGNTISFVNDSGESKEFFSDGNFLGIKMFIVPEDAIYNDGKYFKIKAKVDAGVLDEYYSRNVEMETSGTYLISGSGFMSSHTETGTYTVDGNIVTLTGEIEFNGVNISGGNWSTTLTSSDVWYYLDGSMYRCCYVKEK